MFTIEQRSDRLAAANLVGPREGIGLVSEAACVAGQSVNTDRDDEVIGLGQEDCVNYLAVGCSRAPEYARVGGQERISRHAPLPGIASLHEFDGQLATRLGRESNGWAWQ